MNFIVLTISIMRSRLDGHLNFKLQNVPAHKKPHNNQTAKFGVSSDGVRV